MADKKQKFRHELKFYINWHVYTYLKSRLFSGLKLDLNAVVDDGYHIRSLYFDDIYQSAYYEKINGVYNRKKYRIRIYNKNDQIIRLEKKIKLGSMTRKDTRIITKEQFYKIINGDLDFLIASDDELFHEFYAESATKLLKPVVIVDYDREAYTLETGNVRVTFDKNLRAGISSYDIFDDKVVTKLIFDEPVMILEVKFDNFLPAFVKNMIQMCRHDESAISKYVLCRKAKDMFF